METPIISVIQAAESCRMARLRHRLVGRIGGPAVADPNVRFGSEAAEAGCDGLQFLLVHTSVAQEAFGLRRLGEQIRWP
jgi:hypothetical protein